jgi:hypothetical protein
VGEGRRGSGSGGKREEGREYRKREGWGEDDGEKGCGEMRDGKRRNGLSFPLIATELILL